MAKSNSVVIFIIAPVVSWMGVYVSLVVRHQTHRSDSVKS